MKLTKSFFDDIRKLIVSARGAVARGVNLIQVHTNFEIGRRIVEQEQKGKNRAAYGQEVIKALAERLTHEFGNGFSKSNLEYMRRFFLTYRYRTPMVHSVAGKSSSLSKNRNPSGQSPIAQSAIGQLAADGKIQMSSDRTSIAQSLIGPFPSSTALHARPFTLSWTHYLFLLGIKNPDERSFYEIEATGQSWTVRELKRQFDTSLYERLALSRDKKTMNYFDREVTTPDESATVGIIRCKQKNKALVRITLPKDANIHASEYQLYLPSKAELTRKLVEWARDRQVRE